MAKLNLLKSEKIRDEITRTQKKKIRALYESIANRLKADIRNLPKTASGQLQKLYLSRLKEDIKASLNGIQRELNEVIPSGMRKAAQAVVDDNITFVKGIGLEVAGGFNRVPEDVIESILAGKVYEGNWSLSGAIWGDVSKKMNDINQIIAEGVGANKSTLEIARDLEKYVDPSAKKPWNWSKVYPGSAKKIDYNAQRLARTLVQHAYQQSLLRSVRYNPFVEGIKWVASNGGRTCELCMSRDGVIYPKDALPMDHPNGMCSFVPDIPLTSVQIADRIGDWYNGKADPGLDRYIKWMS